MTSAFKKLKVLKIPRYYTAQPGANLLRRTVTRDPSRGKLAQADFDRRAFELMRWAI